MGVKKSRQNMEAVWIATKIKPTVTCATQPIQKIRQNPFITMGQTNRKQTQDWRDNYQ